MESFTGKLAVVTGGGTGMGRELTRQLAAEGCDVAICDVSATNMADTLAACAAEAPDATRHVVRRRRVERGRPRGVPRPRRSGPRHRPHRPAVQQRRHRRRRLDRRRLPRGVGAGLQRLLGRRLPRRAHVPAAAAQEHGGAHRQHEQRQRLLGHDRPDDVAHRLQRGEVRREGLQRGAHHRPRQHRAEHRGVGRHARAHRHEHRVQLRLLPRPRPEGARRGAGRPAARRASAAAASTSRGPPTRTCAT